jgi:hypothetical protein
MAGAALEDRLQSEIEDVMSRNRTSTMRCSEWKAPMVTFAGRVQWALYIGGTLNQLENQGHRFCQMMKVIQTLAENVR